MSKTMAASIIHIDGTVPPVEVRVANSFVSRVVSAVADRSTEDAIHVCAILNDYFARTTAKPSPDCGPDAFHKATGV